MTKWTDEQLDWPDLRYPIRAEDIDLDQIPDFLKNKLAAATAKCEEAATSQGEKGTTD